jgi:cobalt/nickel transport system permease protein
MARFHQAAQGIDHLERLSRGDSPLHRLGPGAKGAVTILYVVLVISFPSRNLSGLVSFCLYPAVFMSLSGTPWGPLLSRLLVAMPFALAGGVSNLIFLRETAFVLGGVPVSAGMVSLASILLKTVFTVFAVLILIATTSFADLAALLTSPRMFRVIGLQLVMTWRYISALLDEAQDMVTAYSLRAPGARGVRMRDMGSFAGQLLLRSFDRAERVYSAMKCRGFSGVYHGNRSLALRGADGAYMMITVLILLFLRFFNLSRILGGLRGFFHA